MRHAPVMDDDDESRRDPRIPCRLPARIEAGGVVLGDCLLTDISGGGCRIHPLSPMSLPQAFVIHAEIFPTPVMAILKWCGAGVFGVRFMAAGPVDVPLPPGSSRSI